MSTLPLYSKLTVADLTLADVEAMAAFVSERVRRALAAQHFESDEWRAALALRSLLNRQVDNTRTVFTPPTCTRELLRARLRQWNSLAGIAETWADCEGYDRDRWNRVHHLDAAEAAQAAQLHLSSL
ncbi:hypothetical protein ABZW47_31060 [Streptomyces sp. NPDC004549]|uniref:hypothetical protein n=1 Tax=Streptomyces sp. NPDC004549 TaxID=3154283 RepID=UPI0033A5BBF3